MLNFIFFLLIPALIFLLIWRLFHWAWGKGLVLSSLNFILFEIRLPKIIETPNAASKEKNKLLIMEQFYNSLGSILQKEKGWFMPKPYVVFEIAVPEEGEEIRFYFAVSKKSQTTVRQIQGFFPEAEIEAVNDYNIFNRTGFNGGSVLKLKKNYIL